MMRPFSECLPKILERIEKASRNMNNLQHQIPDIIDEETTEVIKEALPVIEPIQPPKVSSRKKCIFRMPQHKGLNYTRIHNESIRDEHLSWAAKGLLAYLLSMNDNWNICVNEVIRHSPNGRDALYRSLNELKNHGYIYMEQKKGSKGKFGPSIMILYEHPSLNPYFKGLSPLPGKPYTVLSTDLSTAQKLSTARQYHPTTVQPLPGKPYAVETPCFTDVQPLPGKPDTVKDDPTSPLPGKPLPGKPYTENQTLRINNQRTNKERTNKYIGHASPDPLELSPPIIKTKKTNLDTGGFDKFWAIYPNKKGKHMASRAYHEKAIKLTNNETMMGAIEAQIKERQEKINRNLWCEEWARASTWLNQHRWEDVITAFTEIKTTEQTMARTTQAPQATKIFPTASENAAWWDKLSETAKTKTYLLIQERERMSIDSLMKMCNLNILSPNFVNSIPYHEMMLSLGREQR